VTAERVIPEAGPPRPSLRSDFTSFQGMMLPLFCVKALTIASEILAERTDVILMTISAMRFGEP
jgi:hypothetical protein